MELKQRWLDGYTVAAAADIDLHVSIGRTPANGAGFDGFFGWVLIRVLLDGWKRVTL